MTLSQLRAFALVARLGSMRAAALQLGVSEPAVSSAIAALRSDLGDPLLVRAGSGLALTAGGRRLAAHAHEIVGLADRARREVASAGGAGDVLRVGVTPAFAEHAAGALVDVFVRRSPGSRLELLPTAPDEVAERLLERDVDLALGVRPAGAAGGAFDVVPFLRYQRVVVASARHRLAGRPSVERRELLGETWYAGRAGVEELSDEGRWMVTTSLLPEVSCAASEADALDQVLAGSGVMLALNHVVRPELQDGALVRLAVQGTPVQGLWTASTLSQGRAPAGARALQRFCTTPDATTAMVATAGAARVKRPPPVHVTLWS